MRTRHVTTRHVKINNPDTTVYLKFPDGMMISVNQTYKMLTVYSAHGYDLHYGGGLERVRNFQTSTTVEEAHPLPASI